MNDIDSIKQGIAEVQSFIQERYDPLAHNVQLLREEQQRLSGHLRESLASQRRMNVLALAQPTSGPRVIGGPYDGLDRLDLAIMRSVATAMRLNPHGLGARQVMDIDGWIERIDGSRRAMDSTTAGAGDELVPTGAASEMWRDVHVQTAIAPLFRTINMPTNPFDIPLDFGDMHWYPGASGAAVTTTDPATAKRTLTAHELAAAVLWSYDLDEDAVVSVLPELRALLVRNAAEIIDDVILNADTTPANNINADGATISNRMSGKAHWLLGFNGLLHMPLVDNTDQANDHNAAVSADMFNEVRGMLGRYGVRPSELAFITDINTYIRAQSVDTFQTLDKLGSNATLLTGQLGSVEGVPVIVSEQMRIADADGKVTDAGNVASTGRLLVVNRTQYYKGFRRELLIETERDIQKRRTIMVASFRLAFGRRAVAAKDTAAALQYNITGVA